MVDKVDLVLLRYPVRHGLRTLHTEGGLVPEQILNLDNMAIGRFGSAEDNAWRDFTLVLARCAPQELARIERARLRGYAKREGEGRRGAAIAAPNAMLLVGDAERAALRQLRERKPDHPDDMEPFERFAGRLAPVTLLTALHGRECERGSVSLAVKLLGEVVLKSTKEPPETTLEIMHDRTAAEQRLNYMYTCGDIVDPDDDMDSVEPFVARLQDNYEERRRELVGQYRKAVMAARRDGMHFYLEFVNPTHFHIVLESCPEALDGWLEGMADRCPEFQKRVRSANGFFVSLCEALLVRSPKRGVLLWRALRECLTKVRFTVHGELDRLLQALWSASGSPEVNQALEEVYAAEVARTDRDLVDLVVLARRTNRVEWLRNMVARDAVSSCPLHRRRSMFLEPLLAIPAIAEADAWPRGELSGGVRGASWKLGQREAIAQHWLRTFWEADTAAVAHAAWRLFLASVDRRTWVWMSDVQDGPAQCEPELQAKKLRFVGAQMRRLRRAMSDNEKQWADNFAHRRYPKALRPWNG